MLDFVLVEEEHQLQLFNTATSMMFIRLCMSLAPPCLCRPKPCSWAQKKSRRAAVSVLVAAS